MHADTGATVSLVSKAFYKEQFPHIPLENTDIELKAFAGHTIPVWGRLMCRCHTKSRQGYYAW